MARPKTRTPGAPDTPGSRPPGTPDLDRQRLFPDVRPEPDKYSAVDGRPTIQQEAAQDNAVLVALVRRVLPDYNDEEARACVTDPNTVFAVQACAQFQVT
jgi:hypothetical protein